MPDQSLNTDREIWRGPDDSIHVTKEGGLGINCGGSVYVKPIREWHRLAIADGPITAPKPDAAETKAAYDFLVQKSEEIVKFAGMPSANADTDMDAETFYRRGRIERILFENFYTGEPGERNAIKAAIEALDALVLRSKAVDHDHNI